MYHHTLTFDYSILINVQCSLLFSNHFKFSFSEKYKIDSFKMCVNLQDNTHDTWYFYFLSSMIFEVFESSSKYCQNNHSL